MINKYIYLITNKKTNKNYIGLEECDCDIDKDKNVGMNTELFKEYKKYGKRSFSKEIICKTVKDELSEELLKLLSKNYDATILKDITHLGNEKKKDSWKHLGKNKGSINGNAVKVVCLNFENPEDRIFDSCAEASEYAGVGKDSVSKACRPGHPTRIAGKDPKTGEKLRWMFLEEYLCQKEGREYIPPKRKNTPNNPKTVRVICITTGEEFNSIKEASEVYNVNPTYITMNCSKDRDFAGIHPETGEELEWRYLDKKYAGEI